jgi:hypothetical protein
MQLSETPGAEAGWQEPGSLSSPSDSDPAYYPLTPGPTGGPGPSGSWDIFSLSLISLRPEFELQNP